MAGVKLYIRDLGLRSRVAEAAAAAGLEVTAEGAALAVVDLADEGSVAAYERDGPAPTAIGFYPHVQRELVVRARELGIEALEKRVFFADTPGTLRSHGRS